MREQRTIIVYCSVDARHPEQEAAFNELRARVEGVVERDPENRAIHAHVETGA